MAGRLQELGRSASARGLIPGPLRPMVKGVFTRLELRRQRRRVPALTAVPTFALLVPLSGTDARAAARTIRSAVRQSYPHWTLYLVPQKSAPHAGAAGAVRDPRVTTWSGEPSLQAVADASGAEWVALVPPGDELSPAALFRVAESLAADPAADVVYTDEMVAEGSGMRPVLKPDWSPDTILFDAYTGGFCCFRHASAREAGSFRTEPGDARGYDLLLRLAERGAPIRHLPELLYVRRGGAGGVPVHARPEFRRAVNEHLAREAAAGRRPRGEAGERGVRFEVRGTPLVSIVIPTAGMTRTVAGRPLDLLAHCVQSIADAGEYPAYEVVVVHNGDLRPETVAVLDASGVSLRMVAYAGPFNVAEKMNLGAAHAAGEHLLFLNDDVEVITPGWLRAMLEYSQQEPIGAVGAKLRFPDGSIQHAGVALAPNAAPGHVHYNIPRAGEANVPELSAPRNYSAVTGACMMTRAGVFREVNGFDADFPVNYNDVDYCLRVRAAGYRVVFTPFAELFHFESVSREVTNEHGVRPAELVQFAARWGAAYRGDPLFPMGSPAAFLEP
ncbi:MAG TPA: glycosyltransferase family 2 protein [Longimicrobium sp.]|jgi:GT2 family glycosyltransferase|uniref:glycosyltransferase family 2 protein n=1 Tax=Longimicrobium sp. TaxID=2029185 RepID=UPI002ED790F1